MEIMKRLVPTLLLALAAACQEQSIAPRVDPATTRPSFNTSASATCPASATVTVSDDAGLRAALAAAHPGDVIAVSGMIGITTDDTIATDRVTLTCATPGSGLFAVGPEVVGDLLAVVAKQDRIDGLVLDASGAFNTAIDAFNDGLTAFAQDDQFTNNTITCGLD